MDTSRCKTQPLKLRPQKSQERGEAFRSSLHITPNIKMSEDITMAKGYKPVTASKYALTNLIREEMFVKKRKGSAVSIFGVLEAKGNKTK